MPQRGDFSRYSAIVIIVVLMAVATIAINQGGKKAMAPTRLPKAGRPRMIELGSTRCVSCKEMAKIVAKLGPKYKGRADFMFIDVEKHPDMANALKVQMIPTQVFQDAKGREVWRHIGYLEPAKIEVKFREMGVK